MLAEPGGLQARLSGVLVEFAHSLCTDFSIHSIAGQLAVRVVDVLPVGAAAVTLMDAVDQPGHRAASDAYASRFEHIQSELAEGPCVEVAATGAAVAVPDLAADVRFPRFATRARQAGLRSVFAFPLRQGDEFLGVLDLYQFEPGVLGREEMAAAQTLSDVTAAYLLNARVRERLRVTSERLLDASLHDQLTGLANRTMLLQRLDEIAVQTDRTDAMVALVYADLDHFKAVNDNYGHQVGDELLVAVAGRLTHSIRSDDTVARIGGDEFVILCQGQGAAARADTVLVRIEAAFASPFALSAAAIGIGIATGVAVAGPERFDPREVIDAADAVMYRTKRARLRSPATRGPN